MQNQPNPDTPFHERRWLDRLRAAWDDVQARPTSAPKAAILEAVAQERPEEARYRIRTFAADEAYRTSASPRDSRKDAVGAEVTLPEGARGERRATLKRFEDGARQ